MAKYGGKASKPDDILEEAKDIFRRCEENESDNRENALADLRFGRLGEQWDKTDAENRDRDGRPMLTINRMPSYIRQVVNDARQNKPSIRVHPVDDFADPDTAEILNGVIRNIEVVSKADLAYDTAIDSAVSCGFGYFRVDVEYACDDTFDMDILINRIANPFTVYADPTSTEADSSDWNCAFVTELLEDDEFERQYPGAELVDWETVKGDEASRLWRQQDSVRVAEYWTRQKVQGNLLRLSDGQILLEDDFAPNAEFFSEAGIAVVGQRPIQSFEVRQHIITGAEVLETNEWAGKYIPIIPVYGDEINVEGKRHFQSLIHFAKDSQRMYNYWRTAATELVALAPKAPFIGPAGAFDTDPRWATANAVSYPYLEYEGEVPPQRHPFAGMPAGAWQESVTASYDIKSVLGLHDASLGIPSNETSGRAIMARQREGDISTFHFIDNMTRSIRQAGLVILDLIPHVYGEPRVMRIMGEDGMPQTVPVNQVTPMMSPEGMPQMDEMGQPAMRIYDLTAGKYDVTVKAGPSFTTRREEAATQMIDLIRSFPEAAPIMGDILAETLDWPKADEIAKRLKTILPPSATGGNPEADALRAELEQGAQFVMQLQQALTSKEQETAIDAQKLQIDAAKVQNDADKVAVERYKAETDRMTAEEEAQLRRASVGVGPGTVTVPPGLM